MENKIFDILVNFEKSDSITSDTINIVQGDYNSIEFNFQLSKNDYKTAMFYMVKPSGLHFASAIENNKVIFNDNSAFNEVGKYLFSVALYGSDSRLTNTAKGTLNVIDGQLNMDDEIVQQENYTILDSLINDVLSLKDDIETTIAEIDDVFKNATYNALTGVLTFTRRDDTTVAIDLPLELLISSGYYDSTAKELVLVLANGDSLKIPVEDLVNEYYADGTTLELKPINGKLTFNVKNGVYQPKETGKGLSSNDFNDDYKGQVDSNTSNRHIHSNKALLDTYKQTESNIADAISKKHSHSNKTILDETTATYTTAKDSIINNNRAGFHNSIFRGKDVTNYLTDGSLFTRISSGTFDDLFVGDYVTADGKTWRIAGFDVYLHKGDTELTKHHAIIVPDTHLQLAQMNSSNTTSGGYVGSAMYTTVLPSVLSTYITPVFGSHVIEYRNVLTNSVNTNGVNRWGSATGCSNGWAWYSRKLDLMNENQLFGSISWSSSGYETGSDNCQLPLFRLAPEYITNRGYWCWLRNVVDSSRFAYIHATGFSDNFDASASGGVRPCFYID